MGGDILGQIAPNIDGGKGGGLPNPMGMLGGGGEGGGNPLSMIGGLIQQDPLLGMLSKMDPLAQMLMKQGGGMKPPPMLGLFGSGGGKSPMFGG